MTTGYVVTVEWSRKQARGKVTKIWNRATLDAWYDLVKEMEDLYFAEEVHLVATLRLDYADPYLYLQKEGK